MKKPFTIEQDQPKSPFGLPQNYFDNFKLILVWQRKLLRP